MARISTYPTDATITGTDRLVGTDANGNLDRTSSYTLDDIKEFVNDGTTERIGERVPLGFGIVTDQAGVNLEKSLIRQLVASTTVSDVVFKSATINTGVDIFINQLGNGQAYITIRDYNDGSFALDYDFASFEGVTWSGDLPGNEAYTGTISEFRLPDFENENAIAGDTRYVTSGSNIYTDWVFFTSISPTYTGGFVEFETYTIGTGTTDIAQIETQMIGALRLTRSLDTLNLTVAGDAEFGTDRNPTDVTFHGTIRFDDNGEGVIFGPEEDDVDMSTTTVTLDDDGNVLVQGLNDPDFIFQGTVDVAILGTTRIDNLTVGSNVADVNGVIAVTDEDGNTLTIDGNGIALADTNGNPLPGFAVVDGNPSSTVGLTTQSVLTTLRVGDNLYPVPEISSGVASVLPGLSETLGPTVAAITTGRFFEGTEQSNGALFQAEVQPLTSGLNLPLGVVTGTVPTSNRAVFNNIFTNVPTNQRLFFVTTTYTDAFAPGTLVGDTVTDGLYEVITYDNGTGVFTFGRLGGGTLNISTSGLNITSETITLGEIPEGTTGNFVRYNAATGNISQGDLDISGRANGARLSEDDGVVVDVPLTSIEFLGDHATTRTIGALEVDVTGRTVPKYITAATAATADVRAFDTIVLRDPATTGSTVTLPLGNSGDVIKVVNTSTIDDNGAPVVSTGDWIISPGAGEDIMGLPPGDPLILNDQTASFEFVYAGSPLGWVIIGLN